MLRSSTLIACLFFIASGCAHATTSKAELRNQRKAQNKYLAAIDFVRKGDLVKGRVLLDEALGLDPNNVPALTALELLKQQDVHQKISEANRQLLSNQPDKAVEE